MGAWAGEDGAGRGAADGGQSGMKIHTDDHLAVILLHAAGTTGEALLAEISAAMSPVTSAGRRIRETTVNMIQATTGAGGPQREKSAARHGRGRRGQPFIDLDCYLWSRLGSNQRPSACEADALPLSHGTGAETANDVED